MSASFNDPMSNRPDFLPSENINMPVEEMVKFPRLKLMQALSPEVTIGHEKFIPDSKNPKKALLSAGELLLQSDTFNRAIDGEAGIVVIPLAVRKRYVEYVKRDAGGGFVASYDSREEAEAEADPANDLQVTVEFLCVEVPSEKGADISEATPFTICFDSVTKLSVAKKWSGYISQYKTLSGVKYLVTGKQQVNKKKQAYYNFNVAPIGWVDHELHQKVLDMGSAVEPLFLPVGHDAEI